MGSNPVLWKVCLNARDAMPDGGTLQLRAENLRLNAQAVRTFEAAMPGVGARPGDWLVLEVADIGTGIPPEIVARIWAPFFTTKTATKGTGLGLATVQGIIATPHGFITLETAAGHGSTFRVHLPAMTEARLDSPFASSGSAAGTGHGELILIADDEPLLRGLAEITLTRAGYRVVTASDGAEAAELFAARATEFALVITDCDMPKLHGGGLARLIRARIPDPMARAPENHGPEPPRRRVLP